MRESLAQAVLKQFNTRDLFIHRLYYLFLFYTGKTDHVYCEKKTFMTKWKHLKNLPRLRIKLI